MPIQNFLSWLGFVEEIWTKNTECCVVGCLVESTCPLFQFWYFWHLAKFRKTCQIFLFWQVPPNKDQALKKICAPNARILNYTIRRGEAKVHISKLTLPSVLLQRIFHIGRAGKNFLSGVVEPNALGCAFAHPIFQPWIWKTLAM